MKKCNACGNYNLDDARFCYNCGESDFEAAGSNLCPSCKQPLEEGSLFCSSCGYRVAAGQPADVAPAQPAQPVQPTYAPAQPVQPTYAPAQPTYAPAQPSVSYAQPRNNVADAPNVQPNNDARYVNPQPQPNVQAGFVAPQPMNNQPQPSFNPARAQMAPPADPFRKAPPMAQPAPVVPQYQQPAPVVPQYQQPAPVQPTYDPSPLAPVAPVSQPAEEQFKPDSFRSAFTPAVAQASPVANVVTEESKTLCPHCNQPLSLTDVFCIRCGMAVSQLNEGRVVKRKLCPVCSRPNAMDATLCSYCFASLDNADFEDFAVDYVYNDDDKNIKHTVLKSYTNKTSRVCPACNTINDGDAKVCVSCGSRLLVILHKRYCHLCGTENAHDAEFCSKCRADLLYKTDKQDVGIRCTCGNMNDKMSDFCIKCGAKLNK